MQFAVIPRTAAAGLIYLLVNTEQFTGHAPKRVELVLHKEHQVRNESVQKRKGGGNLINFALWKFVDLVGRYVGLI